MKNTITTTTTQESTETAIETEEMIEQQETTTTDDLTTNGKEIDFNQDGILKLVRVLILYDHPLIADTENNFNVCACLSVNICPSDNLSTSVHSLINRRGIWYFGPPFLVIHKKHKNISLSGLR